MLEALGHPERASLGSGRRHQGQGQHRGHAGACLQAAGFDGRYTSPHLINWRERICIDAEPISTAAVLDLAAPIRRPRADDRQLTTFEVGTALRSSTLRASASMWRWSK